MLPPSAQAKVMRTLFDEEEGMGFSLCRTHINSCDFSLSSYSYDDTEGDYALDHFSVEHDTQYLIPMIQDALALTPGLSVFASPWSPPAWMKSNGAMETSPTPAWAKYFTKYFEAYAAHGIDLWGITVENEVVGTHRWECCSYTASQMASFVVNHLGTAYNEDNGTDIKVLVFDHDKKDILQWAEAYYSVPGVGEYTDGVAFHWYKTTDAEFEDVNSVAWTIRWSENPKDTLLMGTEACSCPFTSDSDTLWSRAEAVGHDILWDIRSGAQSWVIWNMLLDYTGGPNKNANSCDAPIIANELYTDIEARPNLYYLGHFSKHMRPGDMVLKTDCQMKDDVESLAVVDPLTGTAKMVLMNRQNYDRVMRVSVNDTFMFQTTVPMNSIQTVVIEM
ncbi:glycoside hydrolase, family 30 [Kipferlia bialata]|uniref:Glycoside hydrolase, family 30 n=1 Tax=Kipferlia bialata TaxID=797122 RepID=A0A9K3GDH0_9EUKA|nr:glycoside hydrolase, family 30 [Kipferlia bialata]|eukprot:g449.t1